VAWTVLSYAERAQFIGSRGQPHPPTLQARTGCLHLYRLSALRARPRFVRWPELGWGHERSPQVPEVRHIHSLQADQLSPAPLYFIACPAEILRTRSSASIAVVPPTPTSEKGTPVTAWFLPGWLPDGTSLTNVAWGIHDTDVVQYQVTEATMLNLYESREGVRNLLFGDRRNDAWTELLGPNSVTVERVPSGDAGWFAYRPLEPVPVPPAEPDTLRFSFRSGGTWVGLNAAGGRLPDEHLRRVVRELRQVSRAEYALGIAPFRRPIAEAPRRAPEPGDDGG
jgi:hypothetical protein